MWVVRVMEVQRCAEELGALTLPEPSRRPHPTIAAARKARRSGGTRAQFGGKASSSWLECVRDSIAGGFFEAAFKGLPAEDSTPTRADSDLEAFEGWAKVHPPNLVRRARQLIALRPTARLARLSALRYPGVGFALTQLQLEEERDVALATIHDAQHREHCEHSYFWAWRLVHLLGKLAADLTAIVGASGPIQQSAPVVLWQGAEHTPHHVRVARSCSAWMESGGNAETALAALRKAGHQIGQSTFYDHLSYRDEKDPGWRAGCAGIGAYTRDAADGERERDIPAPPENRKSGAMRERSGNLGRKRGR